MRELSPRVRLLHERFLYRYAELGTRLYADPEQAAALGNILRGSYHDTFGQPVILRRAAALEAFAAQMPVQVAPYELLVGSQMFNPPSIAREYPAEALSQLGYASTTGHIVHDYAALVNKGINALQHELDAARHRAVSPEEAVVSIAFERGLEAFAHFIRRHADAAEGLAEQLTAGRASDWWRRASNLLIIAQHAPQNFAQALQLVWFAQIFLHAENPSMAISFGRLDQCLWPLLEADLQAGRTTEEEAFHLVCAFCLKCCEGEESQNLTLGGVDAEGNDVANPLSVMFVEAMEMLQCHQPSLTVRWTAVHGTPDTPAGQPMGPTGVSGVPLELRDAACRLAASGSGQPGFMNDEVVTAALQAVDIPLARASDWAIVGCYEATPQGDSYPNTVLGGLHLPAALASYLSRVEESVGVAPFATGPADGPCFERFVDGFHAHLQALYDQELTRLQQSWNHFRDHAPSPFGSVLMGGCIDRILPLEAGGANFSLVGIDIQGLGTLVDSLHTIRTLVFEEQHLTLAELAEAVANDFPDEDLRSRLRHLPGRYGTDDGATNSLVAEVSGRIARMVLDSRLEHGVRPYPAFFRFSADIHDLRVASPDGRRREDFISYGAGPSAIPSTPTAVLRSVSHVVHRLAACGNPLAISLPQPPLPVEEAQRLVCELVDTYFALGGSHVHFNTPSADELRAAQDQPSEHEDLMIRVSGFSARFVRMDTRWQDALIERADKGL